MVKMIEPPLEDNQIQLTSSHRIQLDKLNKTLLFKKVKREGKGANATETNEYIYGNEKYYGTYEGIAKALLKHEYDDIIKVKLSETEERNLEKLISILTEANLHIEILAKEIAHNLQDKVVVNIESKRGRKAVVEDGDED